MNNLVFSAFLKFSSVSSFILFQKDSLILDSKEDFGKVITAKKFANSVDNVSTGISRGSLLFWIESCKIILICDSLAIILFF